MKHSSKQFTMKDKKEAIFIEYERLKRILENIHGLASVYLRPDDKLKSILKKPQPSNDANNTSGGDLFGRIKRMSTKSNDTGKKTRPTALDKSSGGHGGGRLAQNGKNAKVKPNVQPRSVVRLSSIDGSIQKRGRRRAKQEHVEQPLRRTSRHVGPPNRFQAYIQLMEKGQMKLMNY